MPSSSFWLASDRFGEVNVTDIKFRVSAYIFSVMVFQCKFVNDVIPIYPKNNKTDRVS